VNVARDLDGLALAPINLHRRVKGLQLVCSTSPSSRRAALGIIAWPRTADCSRTWGRDRPAAARALKSIAGWAFTQLGAGIDLNGASFTYDGGLGLHLRLSEKLFLEPGLHYSGSNDPAAASGAPDSSSFTHLAQLGYGRAQGRLAGGGGHASHFLAGRAPASLPSCGSESPSFKSMIASFSAKPQKLTWI
jgi:hypothetical protein